MRIFHGLLNICGTAGEIARAQRFLGHDAEAWCYPDLHGVYLNDRKADRRLTLRLRMFVEAVSKFDIFQFYFGESILGPYLYDIIWLKLLGKKIFFYFCGCDLRDSKATISSHKISACQVCWPQVCSRNATFAREVAERYADGIFVSTPDLQEFVRGNVALIPQPLDLLNFDKSTGGVRKLGLNTLSSSRKIRIAHAPSNRDIKGTSVVIQTIERLSKERSDVELVLIEGMLPHEVAGICSTCDFAVDQLLIGAYGQFAVEVMALGIPTFCYIREDLVSKYPEPIPIINVSPFSLEKVLRDWLNHPEWWVERGLASRRYVEKVHDSVAVAERNIEFFQMNSRKMNRKEPYNR